MNEIRELKLVKNPKGFLNFGYVPEGREPILVVVRAKNGECKYHKAFENGRPHCNKGMKLFSHPLSPAHMAEADMRNLCDKCFGCSLTKLEFVNKARRLVRELAA